MSRHGRHRVLTRHPRARVLAPLLAATVVPVAGVAFSVGSAANGADTAATRVHSARAVHADDRSGPPAATRSGPLDPATFAEGSCVAYPPTGTPRHRTVAVDAGHGGPDPGSPGETADGRPLAEERLTLPLARVTARHLRAAGFRVVLTRTADSSVVRLRPDMLAGKRYSTEGNHADHLARIHCANLAGADAFLSIHLDAFTDPQAHGSSTLYDRDRPFSAANHRFATLLQREIVRGIDDGGWDTEDRGVLPDTTAEGGQQTDAGDAYGRVNVLGPREPGYVDEPTRMPGALVEPLFITNPDDAEAATGDRGRDAIATGVTRAVTEFLG